MQQKGATLVTQLENGRRRRVQSGEQTGKKAGVVIDRLFITVCVWGGGGSSV